MSIEYSRDFTHLFIILKKCALLAQKPGKTRSRPVATGNPTGLGCDQLATGWQLMKNRSRPVACGSVWFFEHLQNFRTGCGPGCLIWKVKNRTGPDL